LYVNPAPSRIFQPVSHRAFEPVFLSRIHSLFRLALEPESAPGESK
jgi:hypothetical protein